MELNDLRQSYGARRLRREDLEAGPLPLFERWMEEAIAAELPEPNAMTLATADAAGRPSARIVLLKGLDERGFVFYTNYESRKGRELAANPWAALGFYWNRFERQVRVEGRVSRLPEDESTAYFESRPRGSRIGAWSSPQSQVIAARAELEGLVRRTEERFADGPIPLPPFWGGYRLAPEAIEFWQGGADRLHDRLRYRQDGEGTADGAGWRVERLAP